MNIRSAMWVFPAGLVKNGVYSENVAYFFHFFNSPQVLCHMPSPSVFLPFPSLSAICPVKALTEGGSGLNKYWITLPTRLTHLTSGGCTVLLNCGDKQLPFRFKRFNFYHSVITTAPKKSCFHVFSS